MRHVRSSALLRCSLATGCVSILASRLASAQCCGGPNPLDRYGDWPNERRIAAWEQLIQPFEQAYVPHLRGERSGDSATAWLRTRGAASWTA